MYTVGTPILYLVSCYNAQIVCAPIIYTLELTPSHLLKDFSLNSLPSHLHALIVPLMHTPPQGETQLSLHLLSSHSPLNQLHSGFSSPYSQQNCSQQSHQWFSPVRKQWSILRSHLNQPIRGTWHGWSLPSSFNTLLTWVLHTLLLWSLFQSDWLAVFHLLDF